MKFASLFPSVPEGTRRYTTTWSVLCLGLSAAYIAGPFDLLARVTPWLAWVDDAAVLAAGLVGAYLLAAPARHGGLRSPLPAWLQFRIRVFRADLSNFFFLQHRHVDGFVVTGKNSGSHWLKFMLSAALAHKHGLALPAFSTGRQADQIVGHPKGRARIPGVPLLGTTHTIPSLLLRAIPRGLFRRPPIVVMVRDIPAAMLSNYTKWQEQYPSTLAEYAAGDPSGRRFIADAWWYAHFFNRWCAWAHADPARILLIRYEDLVSQTAPTLARIADHLRLDLAPEDLAFALQFSAKDEIRRRQDPCAGETIVPDPRKTRPAFGPADLAVIGGILRRHLRHDCGYRRVSPAGARDGLPDGARDNTPQGARDGLP